MTKLLLCFGCLLVVARAIHAADPSVEDKVKVIRGHYSEIESSLKDCRRVKRDLPGESAEGGELTGYFQGSTLRKLSATFFGETGKALEEFYFANGQLIFVLRVESHYTKPMSGVVKTRSEERFYFADGKLIRWLDAGKKDVTSGPEKPSRERDLLADAKRYSAMVAEQDRPELSE